MTISIEAPGLRVTEAPDRRRLMLRGRGEDADFVDVVRLVFGLRLPVQPCTASEGVGARCLWLGPTIWLAESDGRAADLALERLGAIEVSDARVVLEIQGRRARDLLAVGTGVDLDADAFPAGRVVGTLFGRVPATLHRTGDAPLFHLHIDRAAAPWLADWLAAAVRGLDL